MNGLTPLEPDDSEFVEVDPSGRYGRVIDSSSFFFTLLFIKICFFFFFPLISFLSLLFLSFCSTMKSLAKELPRLCMNLVLKYFWLYISGRFQSGSFCRVSF